jgi:hypothetical protein
MVEKERAMAKRCREHERIDVTLSRKEKLLRP